MSRRCPGDGPPRRAVVRRVTAAAIIASGGIDSADRTCVKGRASAGLAGAGVGAYFASEARQQMKARKDDGMGYSGTGASAPRHALTARARSA